MKKYLIFVTGGGIGALTNWVVSFVLTSLMGVYYIISFSLAQIVNVTVNFIWHRYVTFNITDNAAARFVKFLLMSAATVMISIGLVFICKELLLDRVCSIIVWGKDLNYLAAIIAITFVISIINFFISKLWVFNTQRNEINSKC